MKHVDDRPLSALVKKHVDWSRLASPSRPQPLRFTIPSKAPADPLRVADDFAILPKISGLSGRLAPSDARSPSRSHENHHRSHRQSDHTGPHRGQPHRRLPTAYVTLGLTLTTRNTAATRTLPMPKPTLILAPNVRGF